MKNGCKMALFFLCGVFSFSSIAAISTGADKTPECLKRVNWERNAFTPVDGRKVEGAFFEEGTERVYVTAMAFDALASCAYADFSGVEDDLPLSVRFELDHVFNTVLAYSEFKHLNESVDLLLGEGSADKSTVFVHAGSRGTPISEIVHGGISYIRSPNFPGKCDNLKGNAENYEWCTGAREPGPQDPRLTACRNQFCPPECATSECGHIRDVPRH